MAHNQSHIILQWHLIGQLSPVASSYEPLINFDIISRLGQLSSGSTPHQVSYCHTQLAPRNTIRLYLTSIQHFLPSQDPRESSVFTAHTVGSFLRGVQKHQPTANGKRLPITTAIFKDMSKPQTFPSLVIQTAIYLALCGFLRPNKFTFTGTGSQVLCRHHLTSW